MISMQRWEMTISFSYGFYMQHLNKAMLSTEAVRVPVKTKTNLTAISNVFKITTVLNKLFCQSTPAPLPR